MLSQQRVSLYFRSVALTSGVRDGFEHENRNSLERVQFQLLPWKLSSSLFSLPWSFPNSCLHSFLSFQFLTFLFLTIMNSNDLPKNFRTINL